MINCSTATKTKYLTSESLWKNIRIVADLSGYESSDPANVFLFQNGDIVSESFQLEQHLCDGSVDFTGCVSSTCTFSLYSAAFTMKEDWWVRVYLDVTGVDSLILFTGYVHDVEADFTNGEIKYTCYDIFGMDRMLEWEFGKKIIVEEFKSRTSLSIGDILTLMHDKSNWILSPEEPIEHTIPDYRVKFINTSNLVNSTLTLDKTHLDPEKVFSGLNAVDTLRYICQINGVFGVVNGEGYIDFRKLTSYSSSGLFPSENTVPSESTYPAMYIDGLPYEVEGTYESFKSKSRLTYVEPPVIGVKIMETDDDENKEYAKVSTTVVDGKYNYDKVAIASMTTGTHTYTCTAVTDEGEVYWGETTTPQGIVIVNKGKPVVGDTITLEIYDIRKDVVTYDERITHHDDIIKIVGNPFIHDKDGNTKLAAGLKIMMNAGGFSFPQFEATCKGLPFMEVGDYITFTVRDWNNKTQRTVDCLIMNRTLKGLQHMTDEYSAEITDSGAERGVATNYIQSMSGIGGIGEEYDDADLDNRFDDYDTSGEVDQKIDDASQLWNVVTSNTVPTYLEARTICFVRGIVTVRSLREDERDDGDDDTNNSGDNDPEANEPIDIQTT